MKKRTIAFFLLTFLITLALMPIKARGTATLPQQIGINRTGKWLQNATEASGFVWDDTLYYVYTDRNLSGSSTQMKLVRFSDQSVISTFGSGYGCQDVDVDSGTLYVYATNCKMDFTHKGNSIVKFTTTNLTTWSSPTTVKTADANTQYYNISATKNTDTGEFIVAYESQSTTATWSTKFIASYDTSTWVDTGGSWSQSPPEIKYLNGSYYIWGGAVVGGNGVTWMAKSNLGSFTDSRITVLRPTLEYEDINTTDLDLVEFDGVVYGFYMVGDQNTYMRLTYFTYDGTLSQFVDAYQQPS